MHVHDVALMFLSAVLGIHDLMSIAGSNSGLEVAGCPRFSAMSFAE
jgi:hypothetical protein